MAGERRVERLYPAFELLYLAFDSVSHTMAADDVSDAFFDERRTIASVVCYHNGRVSTVQLGDFRQELPSCEVVSRRDDRGMDEMSRLWINRRKQHELLPPLFDHRLVDQQHCRQVGGSTTATCEYRLWVSIPRYIQRLRWDWCA